MEILILHQGCFAQLKIDHSSFQALVKIKLFSCLGAFAQVKTNFLLLSGGSCTEAEALFLSGGFCSEKHKVSLGKNEDTSWPMGVKMEYFPGELALELFFDFLLGENGTVSFNLATYVVYKLC